MNFFVIIIFISYQPVADSAMIQPSPDHHSGFVAVVGRPNVGKSTLMNALLGQKVAIVSPRPQTTRNRISGILTTDAMQAVFIDTPGIHEASKGLGEFMVQEALASLPDADLILWVADVSKPPHADDRRVASVLQAQSLPAALVMNKIDITPPAKLLNHSEAYRSLLPTAVTDIAISALNEQGTTALLDVLYRYLPPGPLYYPPDQITDIQERFLAAELVRERALHHLREEIPHAVAVAVEEFSTPSAGDDLHRCSGVCRARVPEGDSAGQGGEHAQAHRQRGPAGNRVGARRAGLSRPACEGQAWLASRPGGTASAGVWLDFRCGPARGRIPARRLFIPSHRRILTQGDSL